MWIDFLIGFQTIDRTSVSAREIKIYKSCKDFVSSTNFLIFLEDAIFSAEIKTSTVVLYEKFILYLKGCVVTMNFEAVALQLLARGFAVRSSSLRPEAV